MSAGRISQGRETEETGWQLQNRTNLTYGTYGLKQQLGQQDSRSLCPKGDGACHIAKQRGLRQLACGHMAHAG